MELKVAARTGIDDLVLDSIGESTNSSHAPAAGGPSLNKPTAGRAVVKMDDIQINLSRIFSEVLSVRTIGDDDGFFELGGNSLKAMQIVARIQDELNVTLPLTAIFEAPTVTELAKLVHAAGVGAS